jgi:hypothetical protein
VAIITAISESRQGIVTSIWEVKPVKVFHFALNKVMRDVHTYSFQYTLFWFHELSLPTTEEDISKT